MSWFKKDRRPLVKAPEAGLEDESQSSTHDTPVPSAPRRPAAAPLAVPPTLGRYEVRRLLDTGGFGAVYLGHDPQLDRPVAIKVLHARAGHRADPDRLRQEARRLAQLHHPGIVVVHDIGMHEGIVYIVSDYLEGTDLREWMQDHRPSWQDATGIAVAVLDALGHAHARRVIHRDVKPANILLTTGRTPVLVDFGLALSDEQAGAGGKGLVEGTLPYMSPEQATGVAHRIDGRTDLYSLGVVLYELLTGRRPFRATDRDELLRQVRDDEPQPPRQLVGDIPPALERACLKALAKHQQDRYTTAADFADDLQRVFQTAVASPANAPTAEPTDIANPNPRPAAVDSRTPSSVRRVREAERRQLTVLVCGCDAFESDPYLALDSEAQADLLRAFLETCDRAVQQFGGTIVQSSEEGMVACFGFPLAYEDAAGRAARSGLAIQDAMKRSGDWIGGPDALELHPWVGIHTGAAVVESTAGAVSLVGEARNVAIRLEDVAVAGQVICTEASHRLFQRRFHCASLGRQTIKGVPGPIELFRVEHVAVAGSPIDAVAPAELSPLIGRDQEVGLLMDRWDQAKEGMGQIVLLIGEPGLGKSRLVHTMKQHVLGQMIEGEVDAPVIEWRCSPHFQNTGLYPAIDFYERALAFDHEVTPQARFDRMLHRLEQYDLARPETVPLWASLLSLPTSDRYPPLSLSPVRQREETFQAMLDWLHTRGARKPVLFIVEDLHWVDASTLEFLAQFLAEGLHDSILTLLTFRPEFTTPWPAVAHQTTLALNRLTLRQVGDLMRTKTQRALPEAVVQQIYDRTGGVPLFVEEFTTMVQESVLLPHEIPATLQDLVMARLDRMTGEPDVAQLASVLGREFGYELLDAVASLDEATLQAQLARLVQADILYAKGRPPRCIYIFKHALLEDALYNTLVKGKREQFHHRIADVLEAQFPQTVETRPELLAHHFSEAGLAEKGATYWLKAGLRSQERSAEVEAIGHLTKGLTLVGALAASPDRDALELQLLNPLGTAYIAARGYAAPEVGPVFQRARELCERIGQPAQLFAVMWGGLVCRVVRGELGRCPALAAEAVALAERANDPGMLMEALFLSAATSVCRGEFAAAQAHGIRGLKLDDRDRSRSWAAVTGQDSGVGHRSYLAIAMWHLGQSDQALRISQEAIALARAIGQPFTLAFALDHCALLCLQCRLAAEARAVAEEEIAIVTEQGFRHWLATATLYTTDALVNEGRWAEALPLFERELDDLRATGNMLGVTAHLGFLGTAHTQAGNFEDGARALDEAFALAEKTEATFYEPELHRLRGELHLAETNDQPTAEACFHTAIARARRQQSKAWELRASTSLARLWQRQGRRDEARATLAEVYGSYTEGFTTPDLIDARALLESLAERAGR